ncbi:RIC1-domain-containing protein [Exidia glandulosa HHB12029]|uniref:RIC1-domain-containing protein n=1 Tax=Exidia glandulosa HHB12029 TaxID=1314781 RepID=A0A165BDD3_EXIGL|nr:RIC1-domain-containing protein [Exidia glandulosa HHB12029]
MYFPTGVARKLAQATAVADGADDEIVSVAPSPRKSLFCTVTRNGVSLWRVRPTAVVAHLSRTLVSLGEHGENKRVHWAPDASKLVIETDKSHLLLVNVSYSKDAADAPYDASRIPRAPKLFLPGPGEGIPLQRIVLELEGVVAIDGGILSVSLRQTHILFSTADPAAVQRIPWPSNDQAEELQSPLSPARPLDDDGWAMRVDSMDWLVNPDTLIETIVHSRVLDADVWITSDGCAYFVRLHEHQHLEPSSTVHSLRSNLEPSASTSSTALSAHNSSLDDDAGGKVDCVAATLYNSAASPSTTPALNGSPFSPPQPSQSGSRATCAAMNAKFSIVAVGLSNGTVELSDIPAAPDARSYPHQILQPPPPPAQPPGPVKALEWSSDGYVLAVAWAGGWSVWSVSGRCLASGLAGEEVVDNPNFSDGFMQSVLDLFWIPGNLELFLLAPRDSPNDAQLFSVPFAKSAITGQHAPDNTRYALLQMDDRVLVYRGADQPDMSVINPEADVWQHIKLPLHYIASNWPIRYASISTDGRLIACAGRTGLIHYSTASGRWKLFGDEGQEGAFQVRGGLLWFYHVLVAAVEVGKSYQLRLYSRDLELANQNVLCREVFQSPIVLISLVDNTLLVYTADNTLFHYLIVPTTETIKLHLCGSISFDGIVTTPNVVRGMSWMIPGIQKQLGDPVDDLAVATILLLVGPKLVLLRPRKAGSEEVKYDMQILADRVEFCWIHLRGVGALENSLWGYDGRGIRVWLDALTIEAVAIDEKRDAYERVNESVNIPLDFYPLSVLMDKGIIIGVEHEVASRSSLPFVMFRIITSTHLFIHHILRFHLDHSQLREAVQFATHYQNLVFFAHALEILLYTVLESEPESEPEPVETTPSLSVSTDKSLLASVVEFLDYFDDCLEVVVGCARKTEVTRWRRLFDIVGNPKTLFETCIRMDRLKTAGSYLLVLHNLEQLDETNDDAIRLLKKAKESRDWDLCRQLLRFLRSIDDSGSSLRSALAGANIVLPPEVEASV